MTCKVELVPWTANTLYEPIFNKLDEMAVGEITIFEDPAPPGSRKLSFRTRLTHNHRARQRPYKIRIRTTVDGRLWVKKVERRP